jgi:hypothetical protein
MDRSAVDRFSERTAVPSENDDRAIATYGRVVRMAPAAEGAHGEVDRSVEITPAPTGRRPVVAGELLRYGTVRGRARRCPVAVAGYAVAAAKLLRHRAVRWADRMLDAAGASTLVSASRGHDDRARPDSAPVRRQAALGIVWVRASWAIRL